MRFRAGLIEAIVGAIAGLILSTIVKSFVQDGSLPSYAFLIYYAFNMVLSISTVIGIRAFGFLYILGWIAGSFIVKDILEPIDIVFNIVIPSIIFVVGLVVSARRAMNRL